MASAVFTFGYQGTDPAGLQELRALLKARILDIRFSPVSRRPEWCGKALKERFGALYGALPEFGNRRYKEGPPIEIADLETGLWKLDRVDGRVLLMCACKDYETCHRRVVAEHLFELRGIRALEVRLSDKPAMPPQSALFD